MPAHKSSPLRRHPFLHRASGHEVSTTLQERSPNSFEKLLIPGVGDVRVDPLPGYLLTGVLKDGEELPGHVLLGARSPGPLP